jgi:hypothetical protein
VNDGDDSHAMASIIDPIYDAIGATTSAVPILERRAEPLADALRVVEQRPDDELVRRERDRLGQLLGELPPSRG